MLSSEIGPEHINGAFDARCVGKVLSVQRDDNNGWTLVQVDIGKSGGSIVEMRFVDSDPIDVDATEGVPVLNPPPGPLTDDEGNVITDDDGNPVFPSGNPDEVEPTPEAGE